MIDSNTNTIRLLPDFIANQIAAGEVVQRPESVAKELVENSLDAGSNSIIISVRGAGKSLIHIIDNGSGMTRHDLELSIKRHATSKVFTSDDLEEIKTFGFRGEALASVCSVANVEIRTKKASESHGWKLISEPSKDIVIEPISCDNGTQIFVRNLFYNVPARRKFLKSNLTEFRYISDTIIKLCLSKPNVRFTFYDEDTMIFDVKPETLKERIVNLLGQSINEALIEVAYQNEFIKISGFIGEPHISRQSRSGQYFFLNGRSIISNSLFHAVSSCYEELLDKGHKPVFILNLEIDYSKVDVNVHPQKHEVKFDDERFVYNSIKSAVLRALSSTNLLADTNVDLINSANPFTKISDGNNQIVVNKFTGEIVFGNEAPSMQSRENYDIPKSQNNNYNNPFNNTAFDDIFGKLPVESQYLIEIPDNPESILFSYLMNRFIIYQSGQYTVVIDQSGLHQRILYDKARNYISGTKNEFALQELLFPVEIEINPNQLTIIKKLLHDIEKIGFRCEVLTNNINFLAIPDLIRSGTEQETLIKFINELMMLDFANPASILEKICTSFAESGAISSGIKLSEVEIRSLIISLRDYKIPVFSPKGKKSVIRVTSQEFYNKLFFS